MMARTFVRSNETQAMKELEESEDEVERPQNKLEWIENRDVRTEEDGLRS